MDVSEEARWVAAYDEKHFPVGMRGKFTMITFSSLSGLWGWVEEKKAAIVGITKTMNV
jgi:hypothetical protein